MWCVFSFFSFQILSAYWTDTCTQCPIANPAHCKCLTRFTGPLAHWKTSGTSCQPELSGTDAQQTDRTLKMNKWRNFVLTFCVYFCSSVAVDFLDSKTFCKNSRHMKGEALMRKRHLEILGYRVVQVKESIMHWRYCL